MLAHEYCRKLITFLYSFANLILTDKPIFFICVVIIVLNSMHFECTRLICFFCLYCVRHKDNFQSDNKSVTGKIFHSLFIF